MPRIGALPHAIGLHRRRQALNLLYGPTHELHSLGAYLVGIIGGGCAGVRQGDGRIQGCRGQGIVIRARQLDARSSDPLGIGDHIRLHAQRDGIGIDVVGRVCGCEGVDARIEHVVRAVGHYSRIDRPLHASDRKVRDLLAGDVHARDQGVLHLPVLQHAKRGFCGNQAEGVGEALSVELHRRRDGGDLISPVGCGNDVFDDNPRLGRGHDVVRQEAPLLIGQARIDHRSGRARVAGGQIVQVLAHGGLGSARPIREHDAEGSHTTEHCQDDNCDDRPLDAPTALVRHGGEGHGRALRGCG